MKKIGLWMAALTAVTVGGVYAAFNYAGDFNSVSKTEARMVSVAAAKTDHSAGSYEVTVTTLSILIDSAKELGKTDKVDNHACMVITGDIEVAFEPADNIDPLYAANGLPTTFSFTYSDDTNDWTYKATDENGAEVAEPVKIFEVNESYTGTIGMVNSSETLKWSDTDGDGIFTCKIPASVIEQVLTFNQNIVLETATEHDTFYKAVLKNGLKITVKAAVPNA